MLNRRALVIATLVGTVLQLAMVVAGHSNKDVANLFAVGGMGFSLIAGLAYAWLARGRTGPGAALGGLITGGACALIGIVVSYLLGDVPASILAIGTVSSMVTGALGGWAGKLAVTAVAAGAVAVLLAGA